MGVVGTESASPRKRIPVKSVLADRSWHLPHYKGSGDGAVTCRGTWYLVFAVPGLQLCKTVGVEGQGNLEVQRVLCPPNIDPGKLPHTIVDCVCSYWGEGALRWRGCLASRLGLLLSWGRYGCFLGAEPQSLVTFQVVVAVGHYLIYLNEIWALGCECTVPTLLPVPWVLQIFC